MWDLSLPGYKYLGPGNKLDKGEPTNYNDAVAFVHDVLYTANLGIGKRPYTRWSEEDAQAYKKFQLSDYGGVLGKGFFGIKKLGYKAGLLRHLDDTTPALRGAKRPFPTIEPIDKVRKRLRTWNVGPDGNTEEEPSLPNLSDKAEVAATNAMGEGGGSGNDAGLRETPVDDPYVVYRGPPDYTFCSLPYTETRYNSLTDYFSADHIWRMTSPYDCRQDTGVTDLNTGAGTAIVSTEAAESNQTARWFNYYAGMYNYYHVVSCQWNIFIENFGGEPLWVYQMFYNETQPPTGATNEDMQLWPQTKYKYLDRRYLAVEATGKIETAGESAGNEVMKEDGTNTSGAQNYEITNHVGNNATSKCVLSGEYKTGDFRRQIHLDSEVENWTLTNTNPGLPEKLLIRIKPVNDALSLNSALTFGDDLHYKIQAKLNYLVEFKELKDGLRYPIQRQPLTVTIAAVADSTN